MSYFPQWYIDLSKELYYFYHTNQEDTFDQFLEKSFLKQSIVNIVQSIDRKILDNKIENVEYKKIHEEHEELKKKVEQIWNYLINYKNP